MLCGKGRVRTQSRAPKLAEWLQDSSLPHQWRPLQSEMLLLGRPTLNGSTYNVANEIATVHGIVTLLFDQQCSESNQTEWNRNLISENKLRPLKSCSRDPYFSLLLWKLDNEKRECTVWKRLSSAHPQCSEISWIHFYLVNNSQSLTLQVPPPRPSPRPGGWKWVWGLDLVSPSRGV